MSSQSVLAAVFEEILKMNNGDQRRSKIHLKGDKNTTRLEDNSLQDWKQCSQMFMSRITAGVLVFAKCVTLQVCEVNSAHKNYNSAIIFWSRKSKCEEIHAPFSWLYRKRAAFTLFKSSPFLSTEKEHNIQVWKDTNFSKRWQNSLFLKKRKKGFSCAVFLSMELLNQSKSDDQNSRKFEIMAKSWVSKILLALNTIANVKLCGAAK